MWHGTGPLALACACDLVSRVEDDAQWGGARTFYESLDLSTPDAALNTFVDRYEHEDFLSVYFILAPSAQHAFEQYLNILQYDDILKFDSRDELMEILADTPIYQGGLTGFEHRDSAYMFDYLMVAASAHSALLVELEGEVITGEAVDRYDPLHGQVVEIKASVDGMEGEVTSRMQESPSGRWRVLQVLLPGGDEETIPWGVP